MKPCCRPRLDFLKCETDCLERENHDSGTSALGTYAVRSDAGAVRLEPTLHSISTYSCSHFRLQSRKEKSNDCFLRVGSCWQVLSRLECSSAGRTMASSPVDVTTEARFYEDLAIRSAEVVFATKCTLYVCTICVQ